MLSFTYNSVAPAEAPEGDRNADIPDSAVPFLTYADAVTGLINRAGFQSRLTQSLAERKPGMFLAVCSSDPDNFKLINDSMGHPVGDELLQKHRRTD